MSDTLMLVSASAGPRLRQEVAAGLRPCPDFLRLEERHGIGLVDWTAFGAEGGHRSVGRSLRHVAVAVPQVRRGKAVLSDGEHLGIPLSLTMRALGIQTPHVVIGHRLVTTAKTPLFRWAKAHRAMDRILVHSPNQMELVTAKLHVPASQVHVVPYGVDTTFWYPRPVAEENLVLAAGREHRDYQTLVEACAGTAQLFIADDSPHSPNALRREPARWPANVDRRGVAIRELRELYGRASVVVVPLMPTAYPFGITTILEGMAMGKAIIASDTEGLRGVIDDGRTGLVVRSGDVVALREAARHLMSHPTERRRLGQAARQAAVERYGLDLYVGQLARHLAEISGRRLLAASER